MPNQIENNVQGNKGKGLDVLDKYRNAIELIGKYMNLLKSNFDKKREETIKAIQGVGYTPEDIERIQRKYCSGQKIELYPLAKNFNEVEDIISRLKTANERVIYMGDSLYALEPESIAYRMGREQGVEHVEAEIVNSEELDRMRRQSNQTRQEKQTDDLISMVNEHHERVKKEQEFRRKMAEMATDRESVSKNNEYVQNPNRSKSIENSRGKSAKRLQKRSIKNKARTLNKGKLVRNLVAGAMAISVLVGAATIYSGIKHQEDVENRIEYVDDIIDRNGGTRDFNTACGIDFTDEELERFMQTESKIDSFQGKSQTELNGIEIINTARDFQEIYQDIVRERLEEGFGYSIDEDEISVVRERMDLDGKQGDYNENAHVSQIGYMQHLNNKSLPEELTRAVIAAYGGVGIEKPAMTIEQLIKLLDDQQISKVEASEILYGMLDNMKEIMTRRYEEKDYGKLKESESTYDIIQERAAEIAKNGNIQETEEER